MAPGWAALEEALAALHGRPPTYFTPSEEDLDDEAQVESVACFFLEQPSPHWHLVSCGLSELYDKQFIRPEVSGFGFELTMRVPGNPEEPPAWPMQLMRNLGRYVAATRRAFSEGEHMNAHAPLALDEPCTLTAVCFLEDPELRPIQTPNGSVMFLQVLGLTDDELEAVMDGDAQDFIALVAQHNPRFLCEANRPSYLEDDEIHARIQDRIRTEGSTATGSSASDLTLQEEDGTLTVSLGAMHVRGLIRGLRHRVPFQREYTLRGGKAKLLLAPANDCAWHADAENATLMLTADAAKALAEELRSARGAYAVPSIPRLVIQVQPTELCDAEGNIVNVIG